MNRVSDPDITENGVRIASLLDLAASKLKTIQQCAEAKDYRDVAASLEAGIKLEEAIAAAVAIFGRKFNAIATLKALTYFEDGNLPTVPGGMKQQLQMAAASISLDNLPEVVPRAGIVSGDRRP